LHSRACRPRDGLEPVEIEPRVTDILVGNEAAHAFRGKLARSFRQRRGLASSASRVGLACRLPERGSAAGN